MSVNGTGLMARLCDALKLHSPDIKKLTITLEWDCEALVTVERCLHSDEIDMVSKAFDENVPQVELL